MQTSNSGTTLVRNELEDLIWSLDQDYHLTSFNPAFERRFLNDFKSAPVMGMDLRALGNENVFFQACRKGYMAALDGKPVEYLLEVEVEEKERLVELNFFPFRNVSGAVVGCCARQRDVTEESTILRLWEDSERKYEEIQEIANVGHWNWDMLKNEITWSDQLFRVFGQEPGQFEATYEALMEIIHPEDRVAFNVDVETCIKEDVAHDIVHRIVLQGKEVRYVHQKGRAFYDRNSEPVRMAGITQDVTAEMRANQKIVEQNKELEHFVHVVSHNLKSPISNLLMLLNLYQWGRDEENDSLLEKFDHTTRTLNQTMNDLSFSLSLKNVDSNRFRNVSFESAMEDVLGLLSEQIVASDCKIVMDFAHAPEVRSIKSYIVNILFNLILNAISYRAENRKPEIRISTMEQGDYIILRVSDNGIGMNLTPDREKKIFDMYGRLSGQTEGKGLGLYLVKTQVEAMSGKIEVKSEIDVGTTFIVKLEN